MCVCFVFVGLLLDFVVKTGQCSRADGSLEAALVSGMWHVGNVSRSGGLPKSSLWDGASPYYGKVGSY